MYYTFHNIQLWLSKHRLHFFPHRFTSLYSTTLASRLLPPSRRRRTWSRGRSSAGCPRRSTGYMRASCRDLIWRVLVRGNILMFDLFYLDDGCCWVGDFLLQCLDVVDVVVLKWSKAVLLANVYFLKESHTNKIPYLVVDDVVHLYPL